MQYTKSYQSPMGKITIASDGENITGLWFDGQKYFAYTLASEHQEKELTVFKDASIWLDDYFKGHKSNFELPLSPKGSDFSQVVWGLLKKIPYGEVTTYGDIAKEIEKQRGIDKTSARAVGRAVGHNPISIMIPCHRVIGSKGNLTGYAGGIEKKIKLLTLEKVDVTSFFIPKAKI